MTHTYMYNGEMGARKIHAHIPIEFIHEIEAHLRVPDLTKIVYEYLDLPQCTEYVLFFIFCVLCIVFLISLCRCCEYIVDAANEMCFVLGCCITCNEK